MKNEGVVTSVLVIMFFSLTMTHAAVWYVHPDSTMNCVQDCLDSCSTGDTVLVGPGTYYENIVWPSTNGIDLMSEYGADTTIIDGSSSGMVILVPYGADTSTIISGLTIRNGYASLGAGINCSGSSPTIIDNIITGNTTPAGETGGAGIFCTGAMSSPIITGNTITANSCMHGAGIVVSAASPTIFNNDITDNQADSCGGGIHCYYAQSSTVIDNNTIIDNSAVWGGGIHTSYGSPTIINNTIDLNTATYHGGGIYCYECSPSIINNIITNNTVNWYGGGITWYNPCSSVVKHNLISANVAGAGGGAIRCANNAVPDIDSCTISYNNPDGIYCQSSAAPTINYCDIMGNSYGIRNLSSWVIIDADSNWWGAASGPYHPDSNPSGLGDTVSNYVDFIPWLPSPGVGEVEISAPLVLHLQVHPNPFRHQTQIRYRIHDTGYTIESPELRIYDATGRLVKSFSLPNSYLLNSTSVAWDGRDDQNRTLGSGVYFVRLKAAGSTETKKILLVR